MVAARRAVEQRQSTLRRNINDLFMRDGQVEESKVWANIGKGCCVYLIFAFTDTVLHTENTLMTLLLFVIAPDMIKKFLSMRFGGDPGSVEHTTSEKTVRKG